MVSVTREITKEEYDKAKKEGAMSLITSPSLLYGYGVYGARVIEKEESDETKYYLEYDRGESCD